MELPNGVFTDMTDQALLDTSILVVACIGAVFLLCSTAITCICCDRKRSGRFSSRSDSRRDTVQLEDLLSKPSLADPESVFSELESGEFPGSARVGSGFGVCGEVSLYGHSSEDQSNASTVAGLNNNNANIQTSTPVFNKLEVHGQRYTRSDRAVQPQDKQQLQTQHQERSKLTPVVSSHVIQSTVQCGGHVVQSTIQYDGHGGKLAREVSRSVKSTGSPKMYSHKDFSGKVDLDSTALKIHRDSVTRQNVPFMSSARCSFSHEVGHIVHGSKEPRTSLPKTEEVNNNHSNSSSPPDSDEECSSRVAELSVQIQTEQTRMSCSRHLATNNSGQVFGQVSSQAIGQVSSQAIGQVSSQAIGQVSGQVGRHVAGDVGGSSLAPGHDKAESHKISEYRNLRPIDHSKWNAPHPAISELSNASTHQTSSISRSSFDNTTNTDSLPADPEDCLPARVSMRRCMSYVHGEDVSPEPSSKPRRKTFSLNLQIDVHFDNNRGSHESLPTVVCSPLADSTKSHKRATTDCLTKLVAPDKTTNCNQISGDGDLNAKEKLLTLSFATKSQNTSSVPGVITRPQVITEPPDFTPPPHITGPLVIPKIPVIARPSVMVRKRHSEPTITERSGQNRYNVRQFGRFSQIEPPTKPVSDMTCDLLCAGTGEKLGTSVLDRTLAVEKPAGTPKEVAWKPPLTSTSESDGTDSETSSSLKAEIARELTLDSVCFSEDGQTQQQNNRNLQPTAAQAEKMKVISGRNVNIGSIVINITGDKITNSKNSENKYHHDNCHNRNDSECCKFTNVVTESEPGKNTKLEMQGDTCKKEKEISSSQKLVSARIRKNKMKNDQTVDNLDTDTRTDTFSRQPDVHITSTATCTDSSSDVVSTVARNSSPDAGSVLLLEQHQASPTSGHDFPEEDAEISDKSSIEDVSGTREILPAADTVIAEGGASERLVSVANSTHNYHKRSQTVKEKFLWAAAETADSVDSHFHRASSLKEHSLDKRVQGSSSTSRNNQEHRRAIFILDVQEQVPENIHSFSKENVPEENVQANPNTAKANKVEHKQGMEQSKTQGGLQDTTGTVQDHTPQNNQLQTFTRKHISLHQSESAARVHKRHKDEPRSYVTDSGFDNNRMPDMLGDERRRYTSGMMVQNKECTNNTENRGSSHTEAYESSHTEACEISDDSDYDNPWDDLDDAVKRASIRYNRRPSRIATGDTKTLLLKSAEDLGRLLEEADKKRRLRHAINSCQVIPPDNISDSMTIPFTRFSPLRHTVKGIVTQTQLTTSHSTEDILKTPPAPFPKLSLLRQDQDQDNKGINSRRPMSLTSKVKAKITSPETRKRKK